MRIVDVSWRNFNSYGNNTQTLTFNQQSGELNILLGENGAGKTTIAEIITFALYGKVDGKKMSDLPNRINKELWVCINIVCKRKQITIRRGISPGLFEVDIDGVPYDQAGKGNVQEYLESEFYDIPFQVFKNIIVLSIEDFKSFLTMTPGDKRNIIDRLFGFSVINQMRDSVKSERREVKSNIKTYADQLSIIEQSINSINTKLLALEKEKLEDQTGKIEDMKDRALDLSDDKKIAQGKLEKLKEKEEGIKSKYEEFNKTLNSLKNNMLQKQRMIELYEKDQCPTCERPWSEHEEADKEKLKGEYQELVNEKKELDGNILKASEAIKKVRQFEKTLNADITKIDLSLQNLVNDLKSIKKEDDSTDQFAHLKSLLTENNDNEVIKKNLKSEEEKEDIFLQMVENILGDDGVKNLAIKTILPSLNANIAKMAGQMHLPYSVCFDEKFNCVITHLGNKISAKTLSSGQRKKTDFIIIIALIRLMKLRYPELNLLFLDELLSSVDSGGRHEILKILRETVRENNLNSWVINHSELPIELFDRRGEAFFEGGFSQLNVEVLN